MKGLYKSWLAFSLCRYLIDEETFFKLDFRVQKIIWTLGCLNNVVNPLIYNMFEFCPGFNFRSVENI